MTDIKVIQNQARKTVSDRCSCPGFFAVSRLLSCALAVGFSGSRSLSCPVAVRAVRSAVAAVPAGVPVSVGCARGVDALVRRLRPGARVFRARSFGSGRAAFARRSVACVRSVAVAGGVWVSFPGRACPAGLVPSACSSACFCGSGSGSWASAALAAGLGVPVLLWLPAGVSAPAGWGFVAGGGGWWLRA